MDMRQKVEEYVMAGAIEEAVHEYRRYIDSVQDVVAEDYYEAGMLILRLCEKEFSADVYAEGIIFFAKAYNEGYAEKEQLFQLMFEIACAPNMAMLKENYQKQAQAFARKNKGIEWQSFDALPFILFPLGDNLFVIYDKEKDRFLLQGAVRMEYQPYIFAMLHADGAKENSFIAYCDRMMNEKRARKILRYIENKMRLGKYDKELLDKIEEFHQLMPFSEKYEYLLGKYHFYAEGDLAKVKKQVINGLKKRPLNIELRELAANYYFKIGQYDQAAAHFLFLAVKDNVSKFYQSTNYEFSAEIFAKIMQCLQCAKQKSQTEQQKVLAAMNMVIRHVREFIARKEFRLNQAGELEIKINLALGEIYEKVEEANLQYFSGLYAEYSRIDTSAIQADLLLQAGNLVQAYRRTYDVLEARLTTGVSVDEKEYPYLVSFMATDYSQLINFSYQGKTYKQAFGKLECNFLRASAPMKISSEKNFAFGGVIPLKHDKKRKKVVLSILIDALSFAKIKADDFVLMPNVKRFFDKGVIFARNYTSAEWTLPSETSIQTGLCPDKTQIFHPQIFVQMDAEHQTIAQLMRAQGYYCMLLEGVMTQRLCNMYSGFHRMIGDESLNVDSLLAIAMKHMRALREIDLFMHMHIFDLHLAGQPPSLERKTQLDLVDYFSATVGEGKSVWDKATDANLRNYEQQACHVDWALNSLFNYLEQTYEDDEYVVVLHSDHGVSIVGDEPQLLKKGMANTALMVRGSGVRSHGIVDNEVTNTMDLHATLAHLCGYDIVENLDCRLPKIFGGPGREYTVSNSLYPGQTYKISIRTLSHVFYLETVGLVTMDGKVNMNEFTYQIFMREKEDIQIYDDELAAYFIKITLEYAKRIHDFAL